MSGPPTVTMSLQQTFCQCIKYFFVPSFSRVSQQFSYRTSSVSLIGSRQVSSVSTEYKKEDAAVEDETEPQEVQKSKPLKRDKKSTAAKDKTDKPPKLKLNPMTVTGKAIDEYIDEHAGFLSNEENLNIKKLLPKHCLKQVKIYPTMVYLINKSAAKTFAESIKAEAPDINSPVLELHPGVGLLTSELLNSVGYKYLTGLEDNPELAKYLNNKFNIRTIDSSVTELPRHHHLDKHDGGERIHSILSQINTGESSSSLEDGSHKKLHIVGTVPNIGTINFLIRSYATKRIFFEEELPWNGVTMFLALGGKVQTICTAIPESGLVTYRPTSVFCQSLFTFKKIGVLPRDACIPWEAKDTEERKGTKARKLKVENPDSLTLMRVDINKDTVNLIGKDNLFVYWYFVRQVLYARTNRIIPELERWCPGCGPRLIRQGFDIYSIFGKLSPDEILKLYLQFVSWPEFSNSSFLNAVEKFQTRIEVSEEDDH